MTKADDGLLDLFAQSSPDETAGGGGTGAPDSITPEPIEPMNPGLAQPHVWTVSELNGVVREVLERALPELWVVGEVANWTRARSGHRYFTLKDDRSQLRCVMWRKDAERLPVDPDEGMRVRAWGSLTLYEARGEYQLSARKLEGEGDEGLWRLAFERLRGSLELEGLLDPARKRAIPRFPTSVGIVTSPTGAALHDILTVLRRRAPWTRVVLRGTRVQGKGAAQEVADAIHALSSSGEVDVLIVGRGGGSIEDLWAFNEEPVARAIAASVVPVISAVGHEVDVTIADLVADLRAPTPSAAAEAAVQDGTTLREVLGRARPRLVRALRHQTDRRRHRIGDAKLRAIQGMRRVLIPRRSGIELREDRLRGGMFRLVNRRREHLGLASGKLDALSPLATLRRGYALPLSADGRVLRSIDQFHVGRSFQLRVVDGRIQCETREVGEAENR